MDKAFFHIAGLLEKYPIISTLLDIYQNESFKFIPYVEISGVYGCNKSKWGSGRVIRNETSNPIQVANFMSKFANICSELVFTNSLLKQEHLSDADGNTLLETFVKRMAELAEIKQKALEYNRAAESYITENCPFKKGDRIKYNGKPGKIEVIKAEHNGNFSYEVRFDKKDGTPSVRVTSIYPLLKTDKMEKELKTPRNYNRGFAV